VPEPGDNLGEQFEPVAPLVGNQNAQMLNLVLDHPPRPSSEKVLPRW
jgi:hypothetical protein